MYHWRLDWATLGLFKVAIAAGDLAMRLFVPIWVFIFALDASAIGEGATLSTWLASTSIADLVDASPGLFSPSAALGFSRLQQVDR